MRQCIAAFAWVLLPGFVAAQPSIEARRFALVIGVNDGGPSRLRLRYAASDAKEFARVLQQLGGVADDDMMLVLDADRAKILSRVEELRRRLSETRAAVRRLEVVFYYSGHSDEEGLLVRGEPISYVDLRSRLDALAADLQVAIFDSCASGAMTRPKGGTARPPFLLDSSSSLKGHAFLTSSAADEVAQESDRIGGSFFTHYLLSAMRGAADLSRSGRVTLNDAYAFAFQETLARTQHTQGGAQHPSYDIQLQGAGDLVLTDLRSTSAGLVISKEVVGRIYVRDEDNHLVVELHKARGNEIELGLARGPYRIIAEEGQSVSEAQAVLEDGRRAFLDPAALHQVPREFARARGDLPDDPSAPRVFRSVPAVFSLFPSGAVGVGSGGGWVGDDTTNGFALNLTIGRGGALNGVELSLLGAVRRGDARGVQLALGGNYTEGAQRGFEGAAVFNLVGRDFKGFQLVGAANWVTGKMIGMQSAGGLNYSGGPAIGFQGATGANLVAGSLSGVQFAAGYNSASDTAGVQIAVGANRARTVSGTQVAVGANVAEDVNGVQLALVNVGRRVSGLQLGLVNVADSSSASIGLLNFIGDGILDAGGEFSELGASAVLRLGGRRVYTVLSLGESNENASGVPILKVGFSGTLLLGLGLGIHAQIGSWSADTELLARKLYNTDHEGRHVLTTVRLALGVPLAGKLRLVFGPSFNAFFDLDNKFPHFGYGWTISSHGHTVKLWPGAFAGIRF